MKKQENIINAFLDAYESLILACEKAGGSAPSLKDLQEWSGSDLLGFLGRNNISCIYIKKEH